MLRGIAAAVIMYREALVVWEGRLREGTMNVHHDI
jgi:hypothetical protein